MFSDDKHFEAPIDCSYCDHFSFGCTNHEMGASGVWDIATTDHNNSNMTRDIVIVLVLVVLSFLLGKCGFQESQLSEVETIEVYDSNSYRVDSIPSIIVASIPMSETQLSKIEYVTLTEYKEVVVDTQSIIDDYLRLKHVETSYQDSNIKIQLKQEVAHNDILKTSIEYKLMRPTLVRNVINRSSKKNHWFLGGDVGFNSNGINYEAKIILARGRKIYSLTKHLSSNGYSIGFGLRLN